jgi:HD-GYP domain-containing protein (c-di-GMP phosphodiesterase class II)
MIRIGISELRPGMVLARAIVGEQGDLLLASGFVVSGRVLEKIRSLNLNSCWIHEPGTESVVPEEVITEQLALQVQGVLKDNAQLLQSVMQCKGATLDEVRSKMTDKSRFNGMILVDRMKSMVAEILASLLGRDAVAINLNAIRDRNNWLQQHSVEVTITAILLAQRMKLPQKEIEELALGCLLMDLGMLLIPDEVVAKPTPWTDEERSWIREHPSLGYTLLRENDGIPLTTAHVAYQHHERQDGAGFPRGLRGENLPPFKRLQDEKGAMHRYAEIAAVCDSYVGLIAPRPGSLIPLSPADAIKVLIYESGSRLNRPLVDGLITLIPLFPIGAKVVVLLDKSRGQFQGCSGVVAQNNLEAPERPVIILTRGVNKMPMKAIRLDLREEVGLLIQFLPLT